MSEKLRKFHIALRTFHQEMADIGCNQPPAIIVSSYTARKLLDEASDEPNKEPRPTGFRLYGYEFRVEDRDV